MVAGWMLDTGLTASAAEADHHRWVREAHHRIDGYIPSMAEYRPLRLAAGGLDLPVAFGELCLDRELPPKLRRHPVLRRLEELAFMVNLAENDLVSLDRDEADHAPPTTWSE